MGKVRILTDIQIPQSPLWCGATTPLEARSRKESPPGLPLALRGMVLPFFNLVRILNRRREHDVVVTANERTAQLYGLFRKIFHLKSPRQIVLELMLDEEKDGLIWKLKKRIQRFAFSSTDLIFVSSRKETESYSEQLGISKKRVRFLPFHTNILNPCIIQTSDSYVLSAGKSGRDYAILAEASKDLEEKVVIVSDPQSVRNVKFSRNVTVLCNITYSGYLDLLHGCSVVVVPLKASCKSTGQVAILEGMALGKPVIASETTGTIDYIESGKTGILVPVGDGEALKHAIIRALEDLNLRKNLAESALEFVRNNCTFEIYVNRILQSAHNLVEGVT